MNCKLKEGESCLHLAVKTFINDADEFRRTQREDHLQNLEEGKRIIKELLFNGASRDSKVR